MNSDKVYVDVLVSFDANGNMHPTLVTWDDGNLKLSDLL